MLVNFKIITVIYVLLVSSNHLTHELQHSANQTKTTLFYFFYNCKHYVTATFRSVPDMYQYIRQSLLDLATSSEFSRAAY